MNAPIRRLSCSVLLTACAGCATSSLVDSLPPTSYSPSNQFSSFGEGNYVTYQHAFTDAAADTVGKNAERQCGQKKLIAVKLSSTCSVERCTTHFYCINAADAPQYQTGGANKKCSATMTRDVKTRYPPPLFVTLSRHLNRHPIRNP